MVEVRLVPRWDEMEMCIEVVGVKVRYVCRIRLASSERDGHHSTGNDVAFYWFA